MRDGATAASRTPWSKLIRAHLAARAAGDRRQDTSAMSRIVRGVPVATLYAR